MKLLTAAVDAAPGGWTWTVPGELVIAAGDCDLADDEHHDPLHECMIAFVGMTSGKATTLAEVADVDVTQAQLLNLIRDYWRRAGVEATPAEGRQEAAAMLTDAEDHPLRTTLRRYGTALRPQ